MPGIHIDSHGGLHATVREFSEEAQGRINIPMLDTLIGYDCPYSRTAHTRVARNAMCGWM